jgi:hypothetical protein
MHSVVVVAMEESDMSQILEMTLCNAGLAAVIGGDGGITGGAQALGSPNAGFRPVSPTTVYRPGGPSVSGLQFDNSISEIPVIN